jgi:hypothetical protein
MAEEPYKVKCGVSGGSMYKREEEISSILAASRS